MVANKWMEVPLNSISIGMGPQWLNAQNNSILKRSPVQIETPLHTVSDLMRVQTAARLVGG